MKKILLIIALLTPLILIGLIMFPVGYKISKRLNSPIIDKGYCYIEQNDTISEAFYVFGEKDIERLLKYYDSKVFNKYEYEFDGYYFLRKIPLDKQINVKSYLRDSTVISFSYEIKKLEDGTIKKAFGFAPIYTFHSTD